MNKIIVAAVGFIVIVGLFFFFQTKKAVVIEDADLEPVSEIVSTGVVHKMILSKEGYVPRDITIAAHDTIEFSTTEHVPFWPASNVHPTHRLYSEFDPKEPIPPSETWSFTFDKVGEWRYHDHIAPFHTGVITVIENNE